MKLAIDAGLGDALLEDLAVLALGVGEQQLGVDRLVLLALRGVDLELAEQRVHAEGAGLVGDDRHDARAEALGARHRSRSSRVKAMVVDTAWPPEPASSSANGSSGGQRERPADAGAAHRQRRRRAPGGGPSGTGTRASRPAGR